MQFTDTFVYDPDSMTYGHDRNNVTSEGQGIFSLNK